MGRYRAVFKNGQLFAEYEDGKITFLNPNYRPPARSDAVKAPMVMRDIGEYTSMIDGTPITTRSQHREHMRQHDVVEVGNEFGYARPPEDIIKPREIGEAIKRHLDEVRAAPQHSYDEHANRQRAEHEAIAALATATT